MATFTPLLNLRKPDPTELVNVITDLNENFDKLDTLGSTVGGGAWIAYTPVWGNVGGALPAIGNGILVGKYQRVGKTLDCFVYLQMGSTTTYGAGGSPWNFSLPSGMLCGDRTRYVPAGMLLVAGKWCPAIINLPAGGSVFQVYTYTNPTTLHELGSTEPSIPAVWANGHVMNLNFRVEIA